MNLEKRIGHRKGAPPRKSISGNDWFWPAKSIPLGKGYYAVEQPLIQDKAKRKKIIVGLRQRVREWGEYA